MTTYVAHTKTSSTIRRCGQVCLVAGLLGAASGIYLAFSSPAVPDDMWSYPQSPDTFTWTQAWLAVASMDSTRVGALGAAFGLVSLVIGVALVARPLALSLTGACVPSTAKSNIQPEIAYATVRGI